MTKTEASRIIEPMKAKRMGLTDQIRRAIDASGVSRYALCKQIELSQSTMSRFMHGDGGLSVEMLDRIGDELGLNIVAGVKANKGKQRTVNRGIHRK